MRRVLLAITVLSLLLGANPAWAAPNNSTGVTVSPALTNITLQPNQNTAAFTATLENDTAQPVLITPHVSDFETSGPNEAVILKKTSDEQHGLAANLQFAPAQLTLAPGVSKSLHVIVTGGLDLSPGGHFAAIRYQITPATTMTPSSVNIKSEIIGYVFLATTGKSTYGVTLKTSWPGVALWQLPLAADLLFTNTANTQTAPRGLVNISGPFHDQVANGIINDNSSLVLPGSTRLLQASLRQLRQPVLPGRYYVDVYYRASEAATYQHVRQSFIFIGWPAVLAVTIFIVLALAAFRIVRRRFKRKPQRAVRIAEPPRRTIPVKHL